MLSILLPSCVSPFFAFAEPHDEPACTVRDRSTGLLSAEGLPETPWGGPFEHYIQSKCHLHFHPLRSGSCILVERETAQCVGF